MLVCHGLARDISITMKFLYRGMFTDFFGYRRGILVDFSRDLSKGKVAVKPFLNPDTVR
jgi:hypothetical protein